MLLDTQWNLDSRSGWGGALHKARGGRPHFGVATCLAGTDTGGILRGYFQRKDPDVFVGFPGSHL